MSVTHSESVFVALGVQHAPYCRLWSVQLYNILPHYLTNGTIFGDKKLLNIKCVFCFSLQLLSETFQILSIQLNMMINVHRLSCKVPLFLSDFNET
jgi:hypothetical protein